MVKKLLLALLALNFFAGAASAQTFPKPPDVPDYAQVTPQYAVGTAQNTRKGAGDTPPYYAVEPADIPSPNRTQLVIANASSCVVGSSGGCTQRKIRAHIMPTHILYDDPVRNYGQPGASHCHVFFGSRAANAYSTFATLRNRAQKYSFSAGGGLNGTAYWMPCMVLQNPFGDGKNYALPPESPITLYYTENVADRYLFRIPRGFRYVTGFWMDDGGAYMDSVVDAANAANVAAGGSANRYQKANKWITHQWLCFNSTKTAVIPRTNNQGDDVFVNPDGTDPWGGNCVAGSFLDVQMSAAGCWDGVNPWSPGGYKHLLPKIRDGLYGVDVCPQNYYELPKLELSIMFKVGTGGFDDYKRWTLSSEMHPNGQWTTTVAGKTVGRGGTFHTDWFGAWDEASFGGPNGWQTFCLGVMGNTPGRQCETGTINATESMINTGEANPQTGRSPQVQFKSYGTASPSTMWLLPTTQNNAGTNLHVHGN